MPGKMLKSVIALALPGGLLLTAAAVLLQMQLLPASARAFLPYYPYAIFTFGLLLSIAFHRSRIFFALLAVALADGSLHWIAPRIATYRAGHVMFDAIALLLPVNLLALAFARDRGIITARGRWRVAFIGLQVAAVTLICLPQPARAAALLQHNFVAPRFSEWSRVAQPALLAFAIAGVALLLRLLWRRRPVESGLFWTLIASFVALNVSNAHALSSSYFATGGLILTIAVLETSYSMAYRDELTDLPSRRSLNESLLKLGDNYAIGMVDVDHFKKFNDTYGHAAGDNVLRMVAAKLAGVSGGGKAFRYGGEEFAVLFPEMSVEQSFPYLQSLRQQIENSGFKLRGVDRRKRSKASRGNGSRKTNGRPAKLTVSIGVADANPKSKSHTPDAVIRAADQALYEAKKHGRNCVMVS